MCIRDRYVSPFVGTRVPCGYLPGLTDGYWDRMDYVYFLDFYYDSDELHRLTTSEAGCPEDECILKIDYTIAPVEVRAVRG